MVSKILKLLLFICAFSFAQDYIKTAVAIAATDLTNINKSVYNIKLDVNSFDNSLEKKNLCNDPYFKKHVDKFTCAKTISYVLATDSIDIIITDKKPVQGKPIIVCTTKYDGCDVIINNGIIIDKDGLRAKGYVPEPMHKW